ncbi:MAG: Co2+/Mg2+ efflux protein ApaG [bacterium]|nr:Co2+/Mg2+ efflux protein ApaG [bacterium]
MARNIETKVYDYQLYSKTTRGIKVSVVPAYHDDQSDPENGLFIFTYSVTLENIGEEISQLINRHWLVYSAGIQCADVKGEGVIGDQPILLPGEVYRYTSGTSINDPVGAMLGSYTFQTEKGDFFDVAIPRFELVCSSIPESLLN